MTPFPPRLHVLLARDARIGVVIRRGPSKTVCTLLWDRRSDRFALGQWLRGRVYERRSDLSPDGRHLIYFALDFAGGRTRGETGGSWTAVSRAPYLKALALYGKGDGWHGGGLFTSDAAYWLNDGTGHRTLRETRALKRDPSYRPPADYGGECLGVYYPRLLRDGWRLAERVEVGRWKSYDVFEKAAPGGWTLRKIAHAEVKHPAGKGCYWDEHELVHGEAGTKIACPGWEWAELDRGRLVWAAGGTLLAASLAGSGLGREKVLRDISDMTFEPVRAPY